MDRERLSFLAHERHPIACPFSDATVDAIVDGLTLPASASIFDVGCGRGEWLVRILQRRPSARGVGVDASRLAIDAAARRARAGGVAGRITLACGDGAERLAASGGDHDLLVCTGSDHVLGGADAAWRTLREHARPGGLLLVAQGFWTAEPTAAALGILGEELAALPVGVPALVDRVGRYGLTPLSVVESTPREWDEYEWSWTGALEEHAHAHPDDDADELRSAAAGHRDGYLHGYRGLFGFAAVVARVRDPRGSVRAAACREPAPEA